MNSYTESDGTEIVEIMLPEPTMDMMCRCIYFVHDPDFRQVSYYTYELSYGEYYLTEWKVNPIFMNDDSLAMKAINSRRVAREASTGSAMLALYRLGFLSCVYEAAKSSPIEVTGQTVCRSESDLCWHRLPQAERKGCGT